MKDIQQEMLVDEEAIVEQRREHKEIRQEIEQDENNWTVKKRKWQKDWKNQELQQKEILKESMRDQIIKAKQELSTLGNYLTSQKETLQEIYEARVQEMDQMGGNLILLKEKYTKEKKELEEEKQDILNKRQHLDALVGRLDRSEQQYKDRQDELEWEVARLNSLIQTEQESFETSNQQQVIQHAKVTNELREAHGEEIQNMAGQVGCLEGERKNLERERNSFITKLDELTKNSTKKIEALRKMKESLEAQLARVLEQARTSDQTLANLKHEQDAQNDEDTAGRKKMQLLMKRLEDNGAVVAEKQKDADDRELLVKDAITDLESRLKDLIKTEQDMEERKENFNKELSLQREAWERERETKRAELENDLTVKNENFDTEFNGRRDKLREDWRQQKIEWKRELTEETKAIEDEQLKKIKSTENEIMSRKLQYEEQRTQQLEALQIEIDTQREELESQLSWEIAEKTQNQENKLDRDMVEERKQFKQDMTEEKEKLTRSGDLRKKELEEKLADNELKSRNELEQSLQGERKDFDLEISRQRDDALRQLEEDRIALENEIEILLSQQTNYYANCKLEAMKNILGRPWRQEREAVSAAFSKWVRVTMFEHIEEEQSGLEAAQEAVKNSLHELGLNRESLKKMLSDLDARSNEVSILERDVDKSKKQLKTEEKSLGEQRNFVEHEKGKLREERVEIDSQRVKLHDELEQMRGKEEELHIRSLSAHNNEQLQKYLMEREEGLDEQKRQLINEHECLEEEKDKMSRDRGLLEEARASVRTLADSCKTRQNELDEREMSLDSKHDIFKKKEKDSAKTEKSQGAVSNNVDRAVSQVLDQSMNFERRWMEETAAAVFERESELNKKETSLRRKEEDIDEREKHISSESQEILDAQVRIRSLAEQLRDKEERVKNTETYYNTELKKCRGAQRKVAEMASRLKKKNDEMKDRSLNLEKRMMECDALERQLRHWQRELEEGGTTSMSRDGSDLGFSF